MTLSTDFLVGAGTYVGASRREHDARATQAMTMGGALFGSGALDRLDRHHRQPGFLGDFAILLLDEGPCGRVAIEAAQHLARNASVGALAAVLIDDVEQHGLGALRWFSRHGSGPFSSRTPNSTIADRAPLLHMHWRSDRKRWSRRAMMRRLRAKSAVQAACRLVAADFPVRRSASMSKRSFCPSTKPASPARSTAVTWTNTSGPPLSCTMKP